MLGREPPPYGELPQAQVEEPGERGHRLLNASNAVCKTRGSGASSPWRIGMGAAAQRENVENVVVLVQIYAVLHERQQLSLAPSVRNGDRRFRWDGNSGQEQVNR